MSIAFIPQKLPHRLFSRVNMKYTAQLGPTTNVYYVNFTRFVVSKVQKFAYTLLLYLARQNQYNQIRC